jgi:CHRD domain-containing protein
VGTVNVNRVDISTSSLPQRARIDILMRSVDDRPMIRGATVLIACLAAAGSAPAAIKTDVVLRATLTGKYLHTTSTGSGTATITVRPTKVCWKFAYKGLDQARDSGIHIVPPPAAGTHKTSVFPFTASTSTAPSCVSRVAWGTNDAKYVDKITADPAHFYVIVATEKYPQGAIGGVLRPG